MPLTGSARWPKYARVRRLIALTYFWLCLVTLGVVLGARVAYYSVLGLPPALEPFPEALMQFHVRSFPLTVQLNLFELLLLGGIFVSRLVLRLKRPRFLVPTPLGSIHVPASRTFRPWVYVLCGSFLLLHHYAFDADPFMARLCWASLPLLGLWFAWLRHHCTTPEQRRLAALLALGLLAPWWVWAPDPACATAVVVWAGCLALVVWLGQRVLRPLDALLASLLLMPLGTIVFPVLFAGVIPGPLRPLAAVMERDEYAYNYCEFPERHQLFLTVPRCGTGTLTGCESAYIAEYDTRDFSKRKVHRFFDASFTGGLRELLCVGDVVQVTMNLALIDGVTYTSNVMEFRAEDPRQFRRTIWDQGVIARHRADLLGHRYAYDQKRDAVFYVSEWTNTVFRLDRKTNVLNEMAGAALPYKPFWLLKHFGLFTSTGSIHEGRDSLFLSQWADGSDIWEFDLGTLTIKSTLSTHDTGSFATTVDEANNRLIASGLWGINVFDLNTGKVIVRRRLGPGVRDAMIDARNNLVYLATTFGGSVWVLDRTTLETLGRLPTGVGGRRPYVSQDGRYFFVTDQHYTYRYETADIAHYFRPPTK